ncbi:sporulation protein YpjB [Halobacillus sp. Marseille-Q1614]|uniref:sporulation protein YpjB n=1 Tax=Halobacillus sp. Marseille-Q1614 TaxID=2709134 RepID=UPI00156FA92C|nr:sporulation protein YpjB [Halobacillus sp. Marseille-Q1614]
MGRAIAAVLLMMLVSILLCVQATATTSPDHGKWDSFVTQYHYLLADGKTELAEKMLNNRLSEMETYYEGQPIQQEQTFEKLKSEAVEAPEKAARFLSFLEVSANPEPKQLLALKTSALQVQVKEAEISPQAAAEQWEQLLPVMGIYFPTDQIEAVSQIMSGYVMNGSPDSVQPLIDSLEVLAVEAEKDTQYDAVIWTVIIIGTTILLTLGYVSFRKFQAEKSQKKSRSKQKLNS